MSIFDRLKSSLTGSDPAPTSAAPENKPSGRFMGKDESLAMRRAERQVQPAPVERGLEAPGTVCVHVCPNTQRLSLVPDIGEAEGELMGQKMIEDMQRKGICEEVFYQAGYDQYWKMPAQEAILRMPTVYGVQVPLLNRIKLSTKLVKAGEPRGFWMRVRLRTPQELAQELAAEGIKTV